MGKFLIGIKDFYSKYNSKNDDTKQFIESIENFFSFSLFVLFRICLFLGKIWSLYAISRYILCYLVFSNIFSFSLTDKSISIISITAVHWVYRYKCSLDMKSASFAMNGLHRDQLSNGNIT